MTTCISVLNDTKIYVTVPNTYDERPWECEMLCVGSSSGDAKMLTNSHFRTPTGTAPGGGRYIVTSTKPLGY